MLVGLLQQGTNIAVLLDYYSKHNSTVKVPLGVIMKEFVQEG